MKHYLFIQDKVNLREVESVALWSGYSYFSGVGEGTTSPNSSMTCN